MADVNIPHERTRFRQLLASNPNYFGTFEKYPVPPVKKMAGNTDFEQLTCVGYNIDLQMLEATIQIKRPTGYGGDLCSDGSDEFVRFFADFGSGWQDLGYVSTTVHDIPDGKDCANVAQRPLTYVVTLPYSPASAPCYHPVLPNIRAVLQWNAVPSTNPTIPPVWGNVVDAHIQLRPRLWIFSDIVAVLDTKLKLPPPFELVASQPIPLPDPPPETLEALTKSYGPAGTKQGPDTKQVEPHRFGLASIVGGFDAGANEPEFLAAKIQEWSAVKLDWAAALAALEKTSGDTTYEQLDCLGLDENREWLSASFRIKRNSGYSGGLCTHGSTEYVAFWVDWENTCHWTYLDTVQVRVHDIPGIPADGLHYTAVRPVDLSKHRRSCKEPKIARIRAVLSWNSAPSTTDPNAVPYWGNRIDTHVLINPTEIGDDRRITILGGVGIDDITFTSTGLTKANAKFALTGSFADPYISTRLCPFGGQIVIQGKGTPFVGTYYRLWARNSPIEMFQKLTSSIWIVNQYGVGSWLAPDVNGFFPYLSYLDNFDQVLGYWFASGDQLGEVFLEWTDGAKNVLGNTINYKMQLKHSQPDAQITLDAGACHFYAPGDPVTGRFVARDPYFGHFVLYTLPQSLNPPSPSTATPPTSQTAPAPGDAWTLATAGLPRCGYVVRVEVYDRTIIGSGPSSHNGKADDKGFCLTT